MALPIVAIVGRPNVGKSSLLNAIARRRISIVDPTAGVTRDRISTVVELDGKFFELVDTGGYGIEDHDNLTDHVEAQIAQALDQAALVLFVVDVREGALPLDQKMAQLLRRRKTPVMLVANKADSPKQQYPVAELYSLGFGPALCISAQHNRNLDELADQILEKLGDFAGAAPDTADMKLAVVGRRNVGKSTFINCLAGSDRVIVSEVPGTTRDAVDVHFQSSGHNFIAIDTAGLRKKGKMASHDIEFYSYTRALRSIRRADVVLMFIDAVEPVSQVDKKLARTIADLYKPCIIVVNKWDLAKESADADQYRNYFAEVLPGLSYAPVMFITATQGRNVQRLLELAGKLYRQTTATVSTVKLNKALRAIVERRPPSARKKVGIPKIYYGTQVAAAPPALLLFVNDPEKIDENYRRYLLNQLRDLLPFGEVPIRLLIRHHHDTQDTHDLKGADPVEPLPQPTERP